MGWFSMSKKSDDQNHHSRILAGILGIGVLGVAIAFMTTAGGFGAIFRLLRSLSTSVFG